MAVFDKHLFLLTIVILFGLFYQSKGNEAEAELAEEEEADIGALETADTVDDVAKRGVNIKQGRSMPAKKRREMVITKTKRSPEPNNSESDEEILDDSSDSTGKSESDENMCKPCTTIKTTTKKSTKKKSTTKSSKSKPKPRSRPPKR